jgi:hypothetical protein
MASEAIKFIPTPKQKEAHKLLAKNRILLYGGAIRGAKSYWGCLEIISFCFKYKNSRWLMMRKDRVVLEATLLKTFKENFLDKGFSHYVKKFSQDDLTLTWNNGSEILFMGENFDKDKDLNRFKGLEINGAFIDEVNEIQEVSFDKVVERSGTWFHSPGCPTKILMSCNPAQNWVKERFYNKWKNETLPEGQAYLQAKIHDNPHVPKDFIEGLKNLPRYQYEVFVNGDWDIALKVGGEFYKCFELDRHVGKCKYDSVLPLHISWDDNVNPYLPCGIFQIKIEKDREDKPTGRKFIYMIDEIAAVTPSNTIKSVCAEVIRRYPAHSAGMFIYGDATAQKEDTKLEKGYNFYRLISEYLKQYQPGLRVLKSNPSVVMRGNWLNTVLEKEVGGLSILIDERCTKTINDLVLLKEAADGTKLKEMETDPKTKVRYQKVGHFTDLFDYLMCSAFANEFANYQKGGVITSIATGKNVSKNNY